jgi:MFS family permease
VLSAEVHALHAARDDPRLVDRLHRHDRGECRLPSIQRDLGGGLAAQQWIVDAYLLTLGSLILVGGSLADIFGEVRLFTLGVGSFGAASALCAAAPDANTLIVFRGLQGIAGALLTPASLALITSTFAGAARGAAIGTWTAWSGVSTVIGPLFGGWLIEVTSWRLVFLLNVPIAIAALVIVYSLMPYPASERRQVKVDYAGAVLCATGLGALVFGFIEQPRLGWGNPAVPASIAGGVALLVAFVGGTHGLTTHGFRIATMLTAGLLCTGGVIGAVGIRNAPASGRSSKSADSPETLASARPSPSPRG